MRADRLVALVLLLRQRGRMTAPQLARELEVSTRTILRDIDALSLAGVPVYVDRGRQGGFSLLPGFRTELTGLTPDETLALLAAGGAGGSHVFGLGAALGSAMRKVVDALPSEHAVAASDAASRILVDPEADLLSRRRIAERIADAVMRPVRTAVLDGRKLRLQYAAEGRDPVWRVVDPIGLVTVRERAYLLATVDGADRTYRLSRIAAADVLDKPADRPRDVELAQLWRARSAAFRSGDAQMTVVVRIPPSRREELAETALAILDEESETGGLLRLELVFQDERHALWATWGLGADGEVLEPDALRAALARRATAVADMYSAE